MILLNFSHRRPKTGSPTYTNAPKYSSQNQRRSSHSQAQDDGPCTRGDLSGHAGFNSTTRCDKVGNATYAA